MLKVLIICRNKHIAYIQTSKPTVGISGEVDFLIVSYKKPNMIPTPQPTVLHRLKKNSLIYGLEFRLMSMYNENNIKKEEITTFTVRMDKQMQDMISYLQEKKLLNKTAIIRLAVAELYQSEKIYEKKLHDGVE